MPLPNNPGGQSLDAQKIAAANEGIRTLVYKRLENAKLLYKQLATVVQTPDELTTHAWLLGRPKMRLWEGMKVLHKLRANATAIKTRPFEASIEVPKHDIIHDRLGLYRDQINAMIDAYPLALEELAITMLAAGANGDSALGTAYDGQPLIDTDHTVIAGAASQSNLVSGALDDAAYKDAWLKHLSIVDELGNPWNVSGRKMTLLVGPANRDVAREIIEQEAGANGETNIERGTSQLVVTPWIAPRTALIGDTEVTLTGNEWLLIPESAAAVLIHLRSAIDRALPEFISVEEGVHAFMTGQFLYGLEAEFGAGYALWQEVVGGPGQ